MEGAGLCRLTVLKKKVLLRKGRLSKEPERREGKSRLGISGKSYPGRSHSKCKGPEAHGTGGQREEEQGVKHKRPEPGGRQVKDAAWLSL